MESIRKAVDFRRVYDEGRVVRRAALRLCYYRRGDDSPSRTAFVASKRVGSAVRRNRAKRLLREACRLDGLPESGWDLVLIPSARLASMSLGEVRGLVARLMQDARRQEGDIG